MKSDLDAFRIKFAGLFSVLLLRNPSGSYHATLFIKMFIFNMYIYILLHTERLIRFFIVILLRTVRKNVLRI